MWIPVGTPGSARGRISASHPGAATHYANRITKSRVEVGDYQTREETPVTTARSSAARQPQHHSRRVPAIVALGLAVALAAPGCAGRSRNGTAVPPASPGATASAQPPVTSANPTTRPQPGTWRLLPAAPVPKGHYVGVWTGTEFIIDGGISAAAYNPTRNTWRALPPSRDPVRPVQEAQHVVWAGTATLTRGTPDAA